MTQIIGYTTIGRLRDYWGHDPEEWGLLGPEEWSDDESVRVRWRSVDSNVVQFERSDDGQWYACIGTSERHTLDDIPPELRAPGVDELTQLTDRGLSPAEAIDYYMVEVGPHSQTSWARVRGIGQSSVSENISKARTKLGE